jgi:hypothetical protein
MASLVRSSESGHKWLDGVEEPVQAKAIAWTKRAVRVRFGASPHQHEVWVWAGAETATRKW